MTKPVMFEFFSGSGRMADAFSKIGFETFTVDNAYRPEVVNSHFSLDVLKISKKEILLITNNRAPSVMWFGTPCTGFSVASLGTHWGGGFRAYVPITETALLGISLAKKCLEIISWFPGCVWGIENPRGVLRKMPFMPNHFLQTVTFCSYEDKRMKPTDVWTNSLWVGRLKCKNNNVLCSHERAPRGSKTGTQGLKGSYDRAVYPLSFCKEFASCYSFINKEEGVKQ